MKIIQIIFFILCFISTVYLEASSIKEEAKQIPRTREELTLSYAAVVKKVAPAVVNIYTIQHAKIESSSSPFLEDPFFKQFFERVHPEYGRDQIGLGSGIIVNKDGFILTNNHVIDDADAIQVVLLDKREFLAKLVAVDKRSDLALLKIEAQGALPYLTVSPQEDLEVGDIVLAIGNPFGVGQTVTHGIVSALARSQEGISDFRSFIQTDAAINPGNSGGALVTTDGRLVGINTAIYSKSGGSMGIGFATPITLALPVIKSPQTGGRIVRPWIGLEIDPNTFDLTQDVGLNHPSGALVKDVYPQGPAYKAGVQKGDIIAALDGHEITDKATLDYRVAIAPVGEQAKITILRQGEEKILPIQLTEPVKAKDPDPFSIEGRNPLQGAKMQILSPALALDMGVDPMQKGVIITALPERGVPVNLGLLPGDILVSVNKKIVNTKKDVLALLNNKANDWHLVLRRGNRLLTFRVKG